MEFLTPLTSGKIIKRYKRFLADIELDSGGMITAHTPNTGSMLTCWSPGWPVLLSHSNDPKRKYPHTLELIHNGLCWIGINTMLPNRLVEKALRNQEIPEICGYPLLKREYKIGASKIDFFLQNEKSQQCFVEVKNVTLKGENHSCQFPDAVSTRGLKHLEELIAIKKAGHRAIIFFLVQREDVAYFTPARQIDPDYAQGLVRAHQQGVEILVYQCQVTPQSVSLLKKIPCQLEVGLPMGYDNASHLTS